MPARKKSITKSRPDASRPRPPRRRKYHRASVYTARLSLPLEPAMLEAIEAVADEAEAATVAIVREAIAAGLPAVRRRHRNREGN